MTKTQKIEAIRNRLFEISQGATAIVNGRIVSRFGHGFEIGTVDASSPNLSSYAAAAIIVKG